MSETTTSETTTVGQTTTALPRPVLDVVAIDCPDAAALATFMGVRRAGGTNPPIGPTSVRLENPESVTDTRYQPNPGDSSSEGSTTAPAVPAVKPAATSAT